MRKDYEVEQMKGEIEQEIQIVQQKISDVCHNQLTTPSLSSLRDKKLQLMAQYNILLEVLK